MHLDTTTGQEPAIAHVRRKLGYEEIGRGDRCGRFDIVLMEKPLS